MNEKEQQAYDKGFCDGKEALRKQIQDMRFDKQVYEALEKAEDEKREREKKE